MRKSTLSRVVAYVKKYPFSLVGSFLFALVSVVATLFIPVLFGDAIDCIVGKGLVDFDSLIKTFIQVGVCIGVSALSTWLTGICNNRISVGVVKDIRKDAISL